MKIDEKREILDLISDLVMVSEMRTANALVVLSILNEERNEENEGSKRSCRPDSQDNRNVE